MKLEARLILTLILVVGLCNVTLANAGSPMMWFGLLHLTFLNTLIGLFESVILDKLNFRNRIWLIVVANYISMIIGLYFIAPEVSAIFGNHDFWGGKTRLGNYNLTGFLFGFIFSFIASLIIEYPFFRFSLKDKNQHKDIFKPLLISNSLSNVIMFVIYWWIVK